MPQDCDVDAAGAERWYDRFAPWYDALTGASFRRFRREAVRWLDVAEGMTVLDVACGTGLNFGDTRQRLGTTGTLIGVDYTPAMLARARSRVERHGWQNVHLVRADATRLTLDELAAAIGRRPSIDRALCTLGLSVIPDWVSAFRATFELLRPGARYVIMDCYFERPGPIGKTMDWIAGADSTRRFWEPLEQSSRGYHHQDFWFWEGLLRVAAGEKPAA